MNIQAQEELEILEERLQQSDVEVDINLKRRVYEILADIQYGARPYGDTPGQYPMPGMLIILGYDPQDPIHSTHYSIPRKNQNIFRFNTELPDTPEFPIPMDIMTEQAKVSIQSTKDYDGAILIEPTGYVIDSGIYLRGIDPVEVLEQMNIPNDRDLSQRFRFKIGVDARHLIAISASYEMPNTTTYTISEETGILRMYEKGRILFSQIEEEISPFQETVIITPEFQIPATPK